MSAGVRFLLATATMLVALAHADRGLSDETDPLAQDFLSKAPPEWGQYEQFLERLQGTHELKITADGVVTMHHVDTIKQNEGCKLCLLQFDAFATTPKLATRGDVFAANRTYAFSLRRKTANSPWVVTGVGLRSDPSASRGLMDDADRTAGIARQVLYVWTFPLSMLVKEPTFRVTATHRADKFLTVEFDNTHPLTEKGQLTFPIHGGSLTLDPEHHWCLQSADLRIRTPEHESKVTTQVTYRTPSSGTALIPERYMQTTESRYTEKNRLVHYVFERTYQLDEAASPAPDRDFTLTAFGLAEPYGAPAVSSGLPWFAWVALAGILCLAAGFGFRRLKPKTFP